MDVAVVCVSGIYEESKWSQLMLHAIKMGARIRFEVTIQFIHLVSATTFPGKYRLAVNFGCEILSREYIYLSCAQNDDLLVSLTAKKCLARKELATFCPVISATFGLVNQEDDYMQEISVEKGAQIAQPNLADCEVLVIDDGNLISKIHSKTFFSRFSALMLSIVANA